VLSLDAAAMSLLFPNAFTVEYGNLWPELLVTVPDKFTVTVCPNALQHPKKNRLTERTMII